MGRANSKRSYTLGRCYFMLPGSSHSSEKK